jgi:hypothetical protein
MTLTRSRTRRRVDLRPTPVHTTRLAFQRTWLAYVSGLIVTLRTACERREDAAVFSLAATVAASGAMLLVRRVHRLGQAAHTRRRHTLRPRAVGLATTALLACSLALPVLHALTLSAANGRPHLQRQISHRPRIDAAAPPGPPPVPRLAPAVALPRLHAAHTVRGRRDRRLRTAVAHTWAPRYAVAYGGHRRTSGGFFAHEHRLGHRHRRRLRDRHRDPRRPALAAGPDRTHRSGPASYTARPTVVSSGRVCTSAALP